MLLPAAVRLACLIHAASVRSEPESNSHYRNSAQPDSRPTVSLSGLIPTLACSIASLPNRKVVLKTVQLSKNNRQRGAAACACPSVTQLISLAVRTAAVNPPAKIAFYRSRAGRTSRRTLSAARGRDYQFPQTESTPREKIFFMNWCSFLKFACPPILLASGQL